MADLVARLDEGAADIMRPDDAEFERDAAFLGIADRRRHAGIGNRHHHVGRDRILAGEFGADLLAHRVN